MEAAALADVLLGGASEFAAAGLDVRVVAGARAVGGGGEARAARARVVSSTGVVEVPGLPVPVTNGLGAGDAFAAAFGAAWLRGSSPEEAARQGDAAGAIVATRLACSAAMPTAAEVGLLLDGGTVVDGAVSAAPAVGSSS